MKTITIKEFLEIVENGEGQIEVCEYDGKSIFTIDIKKPRKTIVYLEIPKEENGYEFIYRELIGKFEGKYQKYCIGNMCQYCVALVIGKAVVHLKYFRTEGQSFLFGLFQENL